MRVSSSLSNTYFDDDTLLEFITTRVVEYMNAIVAFQAPVLANGKIGRNEKSQIHVADVIRMSAVNARLELNKPSHELSSVTGHEHGLGLRDRSRVGLCDVKFRI